MSLQCQEGRYRSGLFLRLAIGSVFLASFAACGGCKLCHKDKTWTNGECAYDKRIQAAPCTTCAHYSPRRIASDGPSAAELAKRASVLEAACDPMCVDLYFQATWKTWQCVAALGEKPSRSDLLEMSQAYDACLAKLLMTAQRFQRLDPTTGLTVFHAGQLVTIPVALYGFGWTAEDFNQIEVVGDYELTKTAKEVTMSGVGVPLVVVRRRCYDEQFYRRIQPFAATAVLRSRPDCGGSSPAAMQELVLEFYNPARCTQLAGADKRWVLAGDLTAPLAWAKSLNANDPITAFLRPDSADAKAQLVMMEPYQPGKIPIVFVHGLLSDPMTWVTLGNGLLGESWFRDRYQVWFFRYASGTPFLVTAATLRQELNAAVVSSPCVDDPAAQQMVLVGHSMGGLVAKLQVTASGNALWDLVANRPLSEVNASDADRQRMAEVFFFEPQPFIREVIFIGTPHRGAEMASRGVGRVSSCLARSTSEADERHRRVVAANPGVFKHVVAGHIPTSIDLLEPDNPLLVAMENMQVGPCVQLHSIIGVAKLKHHSGPSDGVVPLTSASIRCVASEKLVSETHEELHEAATTLIELERILQRQILAFDRSLHAAACRVGQ